MGLRLDKRPGDEAGVLVLMGLVSLLARTLLNTVPLALTCLSPRFALRRERTSTVPCPRIHCDAVRPSCVVVEKLSMILLSPLEQPCKEPMAPPSSAGLSALAVLTLGREASRLQGFLIRLAMSTGQDLPKHTCIGDIIAAQHDGT